MFALISCEQHLCATENNYKIEITVGDVKFWICFWLVNMPSTPAQRKRTSLNTEDVDKTCVAEHNMAWNYLLLTAFMFYTI